MTKTALRPRVLADGALLCAAAVWGIGFFFQKAAMLHLDPFAFIAARGALAALALAPLALREHHRLGAVPATGFWAHALGGGVTFTGGAALQQLGLETATITNAGFLTALYVVIVPFIAWVWIGKRPTAVVWVAATLSAAGTWLLGGGGIERLTRGDAFVALGALFWALQVVVTGRVAQHRRPFAYTAVMFLTAAVLSSGASVVWEATPASAFAAAAVDIVYVALLSGALSFSVFTFALEHTPAAEAAVIASTETLFAALAGYLLLEERLSPQAWAGAGLILSSAIMVQIYPVKARASAKRG